MVVQPNSGVRELPSYIRIRTKCLLHRNELSVWSFGPLGRRTLATSGTQDGHLVKIENGCNLSRPYKAYGHVEKGTLFVYEEVPNDLQEEFTST